MKKRGLYLFILFLLIASLILTFISCVKTNPIPSSEVRTASDSTSDEEDESSSHPESDPGLEDEGYYIPQEYEKGEPVLYNGITRIYYGADAEEITLTGLPVYTLEGLLRTPKCRKLFLYSQTGKIDWTPVGTLKELTELKVNFTPVLDFSAITGAEKLESVFCLRAGLYNLKGIGKLASLRSLSLGGGILSDPEAIGEIATLEELTLAGMGIESLSFLGKGMPVLKMLDLSHNPLSDLSALTPEAFPQLREIKVSACPCPDEIANTLGQVFEGHDIKVVTVDERDVSLASAWANTDFGEECVFSGLPEDAMIREKLASAVTVDLTLLESASRDLVPELSPIASLPSIRTLRLARGGLTDASFLSGMTALESLSLEENMLTDEALPALYSLTSLKELDLSGNPVTADGLRKLQKALPSTQIRVFQKELRYCYPEDVYDPLFAV